MLARLDKFGTFHVCFTLSSADYCLPENLTSILVERGIGLRCTIDSTQDDKYEELTNNKWIDIDTYIESEMDETMHAVFRRYVLTSQQ